MREYLQAVARKAQLDFVPLFESPLYGESRSNGM